MLLKCFNLWSQYLIFYVILEKPSSCCSLIKKVSFFDGFSILYMNKHVLWLMGRQFTSNIITAQAIFNFISVETCSSKIRGQKRVLNTFCCYGWEMWHHFINGQRAGSEMWGSGAPWLWEKGNGNSQEWLSHGWCCYPEPQCPAGSKDTGTNPAFTRAAALGEQMSPCSFTECPKPLFPNAGEVIWAVMMSVFWLQGWLFCF